MDLSSTIAPKSDQLNADDLLAGPITVTIENVTAGNPEQPVNIHLNERPGRPYRPSKSMRRILVQAWGPDSDAYHGRRLTLYRDPTITFGRDQVGGIRISHLSHLDKPMTAALTVKRGQRKAITIQPLPTDATTAPVETLLDRMWTVLAEHVEKPEWKPYIVDTIGHDFEASTDLTDDEIRTVIDTLTTKEN